MDNFRKFNTRPKRASAIDGFVSAPGRASSTPRLGRSTGASRPTQPAKVLLDDFRRPEGFRASPQPVIGVDSKVAPRPKRLPQSPPRFLDIPNKIASIRNRGRDKAKLPLRKKLKRGGAVAGVLLIMTAGFLAGKAYIARGNIFKGGGAAAALEENVDPSKLNGEGDGRVNIMLLGKGGDGHDAPDLTDTILIASIDPVQNEAAILSIPRDLWVKNGYGSSKINAVYANAKYNVLGGKKTSDLEKKAENAGLLAIEKVVEDSLGIPVHYYSIVDFEAFQKAIDAVGGVDIDVKTPLYDPMRINNRNYILDVKVGQNHFDGFRGLAYARSRYASPRGDFDRGQRQREILIALKTKVISAGTFSNPKRISQLIDAFGSHVQTNMTLGEMLRMVEIGKNIPGEKVASLSLADPPNVLVTTDNINGQSVVVPKAGVGNYTAIQSFVRNALKDAFLKKEDASLAVFNGTLTNGLAATKAEELRSYGYNITTVANTTTKNYPKTVLIDLRNGQKRYTKSYLEKRFGVTVVTTVPDASLSYGTADFVIILGNDQAQ